ncbi:MerC domain-containing protein [Kordia sp.]|uniref:MerC domain-containing protein n=1 Tax=Kordia sp. TaxID=1965332 RepID=UPI003B5B0B6C
MMILYKSKSDNIGIFASSLCLLHCLLTPMLFIVQTQIISHEVSAPLWWKTLDYVFLLISFMAIYWSTKTTSKLWMKYALWSAWTCLCIIILNEKMALLPIPEYAIYIVSMALVFLHLYNKKYCKCQEEQCCV